MCAHPNRRTAGEAVHQTEPRAAGHLSGPESAESSVRLWGSKSTQLDAFPMIEDACHHLVCQFQCATSRCPVHGRSAPRAHGIEERAQLGAKRLFLLRRKRGEIKLRLRAGLDDAHTQRVLPSEIHGNVFVRLEKTQLAHALGRNAARRDIGNRAGGKIEARMRDVHLIGQNGNTNGFDVRHRSVNQGKQDIQIVDHHVVHDVYVKTARREYAEADGLQNIADD